MKVLPIVVSSLAICLGLSSAIYQCPDGSFTNLSVGGARSRLLITDRLQIPKVTSPYQTFKTYNTATISSIEVLSQSQTLEVGGCVKITGGGVGWTFVVLYFQADQGHEINYTIKIYGK